MKFILSTCRTAFNWAARRRLLPPYSKNAFSRFQIDKLRDAETADEGLRIVSLQQEKAFFVACNELRRGIFRTLAAYGLRVAELTNLLIKNVDLKAETIQICSKLALFWRAKTARRRQLSVTCEIRKIFERLIADRKAGFVFVNEEFVAACGAVPGSSAPTQTSANGYRRLRPKRSAKTRAQRRRISGAR